MNNRVIWITGASSGIGLATATLLAQKGYKTVLSGRDKAKLDQVVTELSDQGLDVSGASVDVTDPVAVTRVADGIVEEFGSIDVLVANAGANVGARAWGEVSVEDFDSLLRLNVNGVFYCASAALPHMRKQNSGHIIALSSWAGVRVSAKPGPAYTSAKHAVIALTESLNAAEYQNGIRACSICPGEVATAAMAKRKVPPSDLALARMLKSDDIARTIAFVVDAPDHVTINNIVMSPTWNGAYGAPAV